MKGVSSFIIIIKMYSVSILSIIFLSCSIKVTLSYLKPLRSKYIEACSIYIYIYILFIII